MSSRFLFPTPHSEVFRGEAWGVFSKLTMIRFPRSSRRRNRSTRIAGAALVEFALVALVLYFLLAATIELGRSIYGAQSVQTVARVAARELAVTPLPAIGESLDTLLNEPLPEDSTDPRFVAMDRVRREIYDPCKLVLDLDDFEDAAQLDAFFAGLPIGNQLLRPLMIFDELPDGARLLRYPGALLEDVDGTCAETDTGFLVAIPRELNDGATIDWLDVVEEILDPNTGQSRFPVNAAPLGTGGVVALRVNYPFQSTMLSGYRATAPTADDPLPPNIANPILADDAGIVAANDPRGALALDGDTRVGAYTGRYGLGRQLALGAELRPFRKLLSATAIFRREVFLPPAPVPTPPTSP